MLLPIHSEHHAYGLEDQFPIQPKAAVLYVLEVQLHPLVKGQLGAVGLHLPVAGEARRGVEPLPPVVGVLGHLPGQGRTGTHNAHVAFQNIDELGQFIDARFSDEVSHPGDPRVVLHLKDRAVHLILVQHLFQLGLGVGHRRAELVELEDLPISPHTVLREDGACARAVDPDDQRHNGHRDGQDDQRQQGKENILGTPS